ncbi:MAG: hypothetical protein HC915_17245 [Anaerolineae bacterium]|nr:hypothetical protein [Anaerolineae bacterium]
MQPLRAQDDRLVILTPENRFFLWTPDALADAEVPGTDVLATLARFLEWRAYPNFDVEAAQVSEIGPYTSAQVVQSGRVMAVTLAENHYVVLEFGILPDPALDAALLAEAERLVASFQWLDEAAFAIQVQLGAQFESQDGRLRFRYPTRWAAPTEAQPGIWQLGDSAGRVNLYTAARLAQLAEEDDLTGSIAALQRVASLPGLRVGEPAEVQLGGYAGLEAPLFRVNNDGSERLTGSALVVQVPGEGVFGLVAISARAEDAATLNALVRGIAGSLLDGQGVTVNAAAEGPRQPQRQPWPPRPRWPLLQACSRRLLASAPRLRLRPPRPRQCQAQRRPSRWQLRRPWVASHGRPRWWLSMLGRAALLSRLAACNLRSGLRSSVIAAGQTVRAGGKQRRVLGCAAVKCCWRDAARRFQRFGPHPVHHER